MVVLLVGEGAGGVVDFEGVWRETRCSSRVSCMTACDWVEQGFCAAACGISALHIQW